MERRTAKHIHEITNASYWIENPEWDAGNKLANFVCRGIVQQLPFSLYEANKNIFFKRDGLLAVRGESVVVMKGVDEVNKFMFRYPEDQSIETFRDNVTSEISTVRHHLTGLSMPTEVSIENADIFKKPFSAVDAVTQTQTRLNLDINPELKLRLLGKHSVSNLNDRTIAQLDHLITKTEQMAQEDGVYPDIATAGENVRRNVITGEICLIDVMPIHADGSRLIGDKHSKLPAALATLEEYKDVVGQYGA